MATLIAMAPRPTAAAPVAELLALHAAGEPLAVWWPDGAALAAPFVPADGLDATTILEQEGIALFRSHGWPERLCAEDFDWVLVVSENSPAEILESLFAAGAEEIEVISTAQMDDLSQSWVSGRRVGTRVLARG